MTFLKLQNKFYVKPYLALRAIYLGLRLSLYIVSRKGYSFGWPTINLNMSIRHGAYIHIYQNSGERAFCTEGEADG